MPYSSHILMLNDDLLIFLRSWRTGSVENSDYMLRELGLGHLQFEKHSSDAVGRA